MGLDNIPKYKQTEQNTLALIYEEGRVAKNWTSVEAS